MNLGAWKCDILFSQPPWKLSCGLVWLISLSSKSMFLCDTGAGSCFVTMVLDHVNILFCQLVACEASSQRAQGDSSRQILALGFGPPLLLFHAGIQQHPLRSSSSNPRPHSPHQRLPSFSSPLEHSSNTQLFYKPVWALCLHRVVSLSN